MFESRIEIELVHPPCDSLIVTPPVTKPLAEIPVRLNIVVILGQLVAIALCCYAAAQVKSIWGLVALAVAFGVVMNSVYSIIHEAEHAILFPRRRWNDLAGALMALFFPAPFT
jgi:fatty acid desaturase